MRVLIGTGTGGGSGSEPNDINGFGGDEDGKMGIDGVRSTRMIGLLSIEDSVLERASMRFANFVGEEEGEEIGVVNSNIPGNSLFNLGEGVGRFRVAYVRCITRGGVSSRSSASMSVDGSPCPEFDIRLRFCGNATSAIFPSVDCLFFPFLLYVRALNDDELDMVEVLSD